MDQARLRDGKRAVFTFPTVSVRLPHRLPALLVLNLTSYPPRFASLAMTIKSLLDQTVVVDRTILWVAQEDETVLPPDVRALTAHGLEIRTCENVRSYKKLVPALTAYPNAYHVTADDDVYYPVDWLASLVRASFDSPGAVIGGRVHMARQGPDGAFRPYREWQMATADLLDQPLDGLTFPTGVGGVLYPPDALHADVTDAASFMDLCPRGDDIWFFWMARRAGTWHRGVGSGIAPIAWGGTQEVGLLHENWLGENDRQIVAMERRFGILPLHCHSAVLSGAA